MTEQEFGVMVGWGHVPRNAGGLQKVGKKAKKVILSWILEEKNPGPANTLTSAK